MQMERKYGVADVLQRHQTQWYGTWVQALCARVKANHTLGATRYYIVPGPDLKRRSR